MRRLISLAVFCVFVFLLTLFGEPKSKAQSPSPPNAVDDGIYVARKPTDPFNGTVQLILESPGNLTNDSYSGTPTWYPILPSWNHASGFAPYNNIGGFTYTSNGFEGISYAGPDSSAYQLQASDNPNLSDTANIYLIVIPLDGAEGAGYSCPLNIKENLGLPPGAIGDPVNVTNGNMWIEHKDYNLPGIGENIEINRFYNSIIQTSGHFGLGWSTKYD